MNRWMAKLAQGTARLAFWRKPATAIAPASPAAVPMTPEAQPEPADAAAPAATPGVKPGWFARLKQSLVRRKRSAKLPLLVDQIIAPEAAPAHDSAATPEIPPPPKLSLLARIKSMLRRTPKPAPIVADAAASPAEIRQAGSPRDAVPTDAAEAAPEGRMARVLGLMGRKWVWIPSASAVLLAIMGTLTFMLLQSKHETKQLRTDLVAAQKELKKPSIGKQLASHHDAAVQAEPHSAAPTQVALIQTATHQDTPKQADESAHAPVGKLAAGKPSDFTGDCDVSDRASVTQNLKNCIEGFNKAMGH